MRLPSKAIEMIKTWRLGFVATCDASGRPNVSPKGTFIVIDDETIAFGEMRSPQTVANLRKNPQTEINFIDVLSRKGVRIRGRAVFVEQNTDEFSALMPDFRTLWADLCDEINLIVKIPVAEVRPLTSPIYETGCKEADLRISWQAKLAAMD